MRRGKVRYNLTKAVAEFKDPDWGDKVKSGKGLSYRPARLNGLAGYAGVDFIPQSGIYEFGYRMSHIEVENNRGYSCTF